MPREYNNQIIESVSVRRQRLRDAALFGADRARHSLDEGVGKLFASVALAAVICAGCVGWSFIDRELAKEKQQNQPTQTVAPSPSPTPTATPTTKRPTASPSRTR
ncbi:hypothetical protein [Kribbella speibonae]|uniref:Uncharacterized protein n=1 Tax=Kribbella speibonae TaxID=1572660 RepID=A0A4R0ING6_9ACTN|nr:hypothetical protein [Kribbella speibonae]TCC22878.1 hypothetical protein E0H58_21130 [Kribbella speibonae]TCC30255.1 hypothetical protein E0H92_40545 [Kribbella speibonae]